MQKKWDFSKVLEFVAYIGTACIAIALMLVTIFKGNGRLSTAFSSVGQAIAYVITMIVAASWVKRKTHVAWLICYVIFVVAIIILYILGLVL